MLAILVTAAPSTGWADDTYEVVDGVAIAGIHAEPAESGGATRLRFAIENFSGRDFVLRDARSCMADDAAIYWVDQGLLQRPAKAVIVADGETVDFGTSHLVIEFGSLKRALEAGDEFDFELGLGSGDVALTAHVHPHPPSRRGRRHRR